MKIALIWNGIPGFRSFWGRTENAKQEFRETVVDSLTKMRLTFSFLSPVED